MADVSYARCCQKDEINWNWNNILVKKQNRFRINRYTEAESYYVINEILQAMNNRLSVGGIFCDPKTAFDCVNHGILAI